VRATNAATVSSPLCIAVSTVTCTCAAGAARVSHSACASPSAVTFMTQ